MELGNVTFIDTMVELTPTVHLSGPFEFLRKTQGVHTMYSEYTHSMGVSTGALYMSKREICAKIFLEDSFREKYAYTGTSAIRILWAHFAIILVFPRQTFSFEADISVTRKQISKTETIYLASKSGPQGHR